MKTDAGDIRKATGRGEGGRRGEKRSGDNKKKEIFHYQKTDFVRSYKTKLLIAKNWKDKGAGSLKVQDDRRCN